jgi:predicted RND superfamily exporter protein
VVDVLGTATLFHHAMMGITYGMVKGLLVALALIVATMALMLRSLPLGMLAVVPNVMPILVCGGVLGWSGIPLAMGTSLVGCVAPGPRGGRYGTCAGSPARSTHPR